MNLRMESPPASLPLYVGSSLATEKSCRDFLFQLRWPEGFSCPRCGCAKNWPVRGSLFECGYCKYQGSVTSGTIFHNTRVPLTTWFKAIWWLACQRYATDVSAMQLKREMCLGSYKTAWTMIRKLHQVMVQAGLLPLEGSVEVETFPLRAGKSSSRDDEIVIALALQRDAKTFPVRMRCLPDERPESLASFITACVKPGSHVGTAVVDVNSALNSSGFECDLLDGSASSCSRVETIAMLQDWLSGVSSWDALERRIDGYLDEFVFRFDWTGCDDPEEFFYRFLLRISHSRPMLSRQARNGRGVPSMSDPSSGERHGKRITR